MQSFVTPGARSVRDVAFAIISHEQTQSNRVCYFQTSDAVFLKDLFSDYIKRTMFGYQRAITGFNVTDSIYGDPDDHIAGL